MNSSQLQTPPSSQVQRIVKEGADNEADFLALRLLNKQARVRLSPAPLQLDSLPGRGVLLAVASHAGYFAAVIRDSSGSHSIVFSGLATLRDAFRNSTDDSDIPLNPLRTIPVSEQPNVLVFASGESKLLVALVSGAIAVYDVQALSAPGSNTVSPGHIFPSPAGTAAREVVPNPGDLPDLVAVLYEPASVGHRVDLLDTRNSQVVGTWTNGITPDTVPTCLSWSPKGKQLAIGLQSGDIVTYSPGEISKVKTVIPRPSSPQSIISLSWLSNTDFYCICVPPGPVNAESEQVHILLSLDSKANTVTEIKLNAPFLPIPGLRPPGCFTAVLRQWEPSKFLLFMGDGTSSDIGLVGCTADTSGQETWMNLSLEETSTPSMPLDQDMNETIILGMGLDLTDTEDYTHKTASGEDSVLPPSPVMYVYASDGTVIGWHVLNTRAVSYPGMVKASSMAEPAVDSMEMAADSEPQPVAPSIQINTFAQAPSPPAFAGTTAQAASVSGQTTGTPFGEGSFGTSSGFGQPSAFGSAATSSAQPPTTSGFGAFASAQPAKFGQSTTFGSNTLAPPTVTQTPASPVLPSPMAISTSASQEPMSADMDSGSEFGGLSLGGDSDTRSETKSNIFGSFATPSSATGQPSPAFGSTSMAGASSSVIKPAVGFGAFANQGPSAFGSSAFSSTSPASANNTNSASTSSSPFSSTGFATTKPPAASAFGQTGFGSFGTKPAFGQSGFGQSSFGTPSFATTMTQPAPGTGGFAAFAQSGTSSFASAVKIPGASELVEGKPQASVPKSQPASETLETPKTPTKAAVSGGSEPSTPKPTSTFGAPATPEKLDNATTKTPSSSPFQSASPGSPGAFSGLTSHPTGFAKLDPGFGAFGSAVPASSPFFNPKPAAASAFGGSMSAFASSTATPQAPTEGSAKPAFGAPSAIGAAANSSDEKKPAFGAASPLGSGSMFGKPPLSTPSATPLPKPAVASTGAFSAFSDGVGFSSFASAGNKSFSELLRGDQDSKSKGKEPPATTPTSKPPAQRTSVLGVPVKEKETPLAQVETSEPASADTSAPRELATSDDEGAEEGDGVEEEDDTISFLSQSFSEEEEEDDLEEVNISSIKSSKEASAEQKAKDGIVTKHAIHLTTSPLESPQDVGKDGSTTPPGSPDKQLSPSVASPVPSTPSPTTPFSLGVGRPSTKPTRSSPLANAPISGDDDEDDARSSMKAATEKGKRVIGTAPAIALDVKKANPQSTTSDVQNSSGASSPGSQIPPPLANFTPPMPKPSPFVLTPAGSSPSPNLTTAPSLFGQKPVTAPSAFTTPMGGSIFSTPFPPVPAARPSMPSMFSAPATASMPAEVKPAPTFNPIPTPSSSSAVPPAFGPPPAGFFGQPKATPAHVPSLGQSSPNAPFTPATTPPPGSLFGQKTTSPVPPLVNQSSSAGSAFSLNKASPTSVSPPAFNAATSPTPSLFGKPGPSSPSTPPDPLANIEDGMQKECIHLLLTIARELEQTKQLGIQAQKRRAEHYKSLNIKRTVTDLKDPTKFGVGDAQEFLRLLQTVDKDVAELKELRTGHRQAIRDLESAMLKVSTRKEEVARFSKAKDDAEFSKMLKARSLGPELLETQIQLRRGVRVIRDRIQKLEDHLQASRKRLNQLKLGKPGLRPPSLDTLNRTYHNIDVAIGHQETDVDRLVVRASKLDLDSPQAVVRTSSRLPVDLKDRQGKRPVNVTPNVAVTTAAALNAERAAQKLKGALLRVRREPLLNVQAIGSSAAAIDFSTPQKPQGIPEPPSSNPFSLGLPPSWNQGLGIASTSPGTSGSNSSPQTPQWSMRTFQPESPGSPTPAQSTSLRQRVGSSTKLHAKPVPIKKSPGPSTVAASPPPTGFSWGPLPGVTPMKTLSADVRKKEGSPGNSLSSSWVTDGFGTKK